MMNRKIEVLTNGTWYLFPAMADLRPGDVFRISEPDGDRVGEYWKAIGFPYKNDSGIWEIAVDEFTIIE